MSFLPRGRATTGHGHRGSRGHSRRGFSNNVGVDAGGGGSGGINRVRACVTCGEIGHIGWNCPRDVPWNSPAEQSDNWRRNNNVGEQQQTSNGNQGSRPPVFGFTRLNGFLTDESGEVIMYIGRNITEWSSVIESLPNRPADFFAVILHVLGNKVCCQLENTLLPNRVEIVTNTLKSNTFTSRLQQLYVRMFSIDEAPNVGRRGDQKFSVDQSRLGLLQSIYNIFAFLTERCRSLATDQVPPSVPGALGVLSVLSMMCSQSDKPRITELQEKFQQLVEIINTFTAQTKVESLNKRRFKGHELSQQDEETLHTLAPPEDFREIPITPTIEELLAIEEPFLRTNKRSGAYLNPNHYLDVQFRLLREDFVKPLKTGIQDYKKNRVDYLSRKKKMPVGNIRVYENVTIQDVVLSRDVMVYGVRLPADQCRRIKWDKSKRLLHGSLLVFTSDLFQTAHFATVANRDVEKLSKQNILGVNWIGEGETPNFEKTFLMVECEVYFEAYRHTLEMLRKLSLESFPMKKFIVYVSDTVGPPKYLVEVQAGDTEDAVYKIGIQHISPLVEPWPSAEELGLPFDGNQFEAYHAAITKEFSIIQGPPGTGKTYLGLKIVETFLRNLKSWRSEERRPILVVCYTNHALDQFLEGILEIMRQLNPNVNLDNMELIRVGGRSKNEAMERLSLFNKRREAIRLRTFSKDYAHSEREARFEVRDLEEELAALKAEAVGLGDLRGVVDVLALGCLPQLKQELSEGILSIVALPSWLGLNTTRFQFEKFEPLDLLRTWFKIIDSEEPGNSNAQVPPTAAAAVPTVFRNNSTNNDGDNDIEDVEDDYEDYDIDELMANRLDDKYEYEDEIHFELSKKLMSGHVAYVKHYSITGCHQLINDLKFRISQLNEAASDKKLDRKAKDKLQKDAANEAKELLITQNMMDFLLVLMHLYKDDRLELPDVSRYMEREVDLQLNPVNQLPMAEKWAIYFGVIAKARKISMKVISGLNVSLIAAHKRLEQIRRYGDGILLRQTKIVGMTTTGAAKNHDFLEMMESKIVIVEEAAEVLESHIVTCITKHCQHLILIGDHQQLRPSTKVYDLSTKYFLDISLFERMLNNNLNCYRLKVQHRMRPEIADLVVGTIYPELDNAPNVYNYPDVAGMHSNLFFIDHQELENSEADSMSKSNTFEAKFLARFCWYLILQGYDPSEITLLTTYTAQMFLLKKEIGQVTECTGVRVTVVDNYQGEENKIILLSLVRSNEDSNIGFLKTDNRICVAISRAKHGLYICGNMSNLATKSDTWKQIRDKLMKRQEIGRKLRLVCQFHHIVTEVENGDDFLTKSSEGGCNNFCKAVLKCTHECRSICHASDREHELKYKCLQNCMNSCNNGHPCPARCFAKCPPCTVSMEKTLPCQHKQDLQCHLDPARVKCHVLVEKQKPCGHKYQLACYVDPAKVKCREKVTKRLDCGHEKSIECHVDAGTINCKVQVTKTLVPCGHEQTADCYLLPDVIKCETDVELELPNCKHKIVVKCKVAKSKKLECKVKCTTRLDCGHQCVKACHPLSDPDHVNYQCKKECARKCVHDHPCVQKHHCHEECEPCQTSVRKTLICGVHTKMVPCGVPVTSVQCDSPCSETLPICNHKCMKKCFEQCAPCQTVVEKTAPCGHQLPTKCGEVPSDAECEELVPPKEKTLCHHDTRVPCRERNLLSPTEVTNNYCKHPCGYKFEPALDNDKGCSHLCKGTCMDCHQGRLHMRCQEKCGKALICGHVCIAPCAADCPPCRSPCLMSCEHSACRASCGQPCTPCKEKCNWNCAHKRCTKLCGDPCDRDPCDEPCTKRLTCGHACVGFCGEPCPPLCRICHKPELTEFVLYGYEEDDDARFVYLVDCKHTIEAEGLTHYMNMEVEEGEIGMKKCPRCTAPIRQSKRFGNVLRARLADVMTVKTKLFGALETEPLKRTLFAEVEANARRMQSVMRGIIPEIGLYFRDKLVRGIQVQDKGKPRIVKYRNIPYGEVKSLQLMWRHVNDVYNICISSQDKLAPMDYNSLKIKYQRLFADLLKRTLPLSKTEQENFETEFDRHFDICEVYKRKKFYAGHETGGPLYDKAHELVCSVVPYSESIKKEVHQIFEELEKVSLIQTGLRICERERTEIIGALGLAQGRWFKCRNGHPYLIEDCGGAMEVASCPACGARIGGSHHRLLDDNQLASEIDGATQPLYSEANNLIPNILR